MLFYYFLFFLYLLFWFVLHLIRLQHSSTLSHAATHSASLAHVGVQVGSPTPQQELLHKSYSVDADSDPTTSLTDR